MQERVSRGTKAAAQVPRELLGAESGDRLQNPVVRPAVVFIEQVNVLFTLSMSDACLREVERQQA